MICIARMFQLVPSVIGVMNERSIAELAAVRTLVSVNSLVNNAAIFGGKSLPAVPTNEVSDV